MDGCRRGAAGGLRLSGRGPGRGSGPFPRSFPCGKTLRDEEKVANGIDINLPFFSSSFLFLSIYGDYLETILTGG